MHVARLRYAVLAAFILVPIVTLPFSLQAQTDPGSNPMGSNQPGTNANAPNMPGRQATPGVVRPGALGRDTSTNEAGGADAAAMRDKIFLRRASQGGMAEVQLGQLAAKKGNTEDVRRLGQKMADDHTLLNSQLKPFGDALGVMTPKPSKADQADYDRLSTLSGADFDKEYLSLMVLDHHKDLHDFRTEADSTSDPDLKEAVTGGQTMIEKHTRMVEKLAAAQGVAVQR